MLVGRTWGSDGVSPADEEVGHDGSGVPGAHRLGRFVYVCVCAEEVWAEEASRKASTVPVALSVEAE